MPGSVRELDDASFSGATASGTVLVEFYGAWCPPCALLEPVLAELAERYGGRALIARVNIDENTEAAVEQSIAAIPTCVVYRDGVEKKRLFGAQSAETLSDALERALPPGDFTKA